MLREERRGVVLGDICVGPDYFVLRSCQRMGAVPSERRCAYLGKCEHVVKDAERMLAGERNAQHRRKRPETAHGEMRLAVRCGVVKGDGCGSQ